MKVFIITPTTFPSGLADTNRIIYYSKMLQEQGLDCEVVVYKRNGSYNNTNPGGVFDGIKYIYPSGVVVRSKGKFQPRVDDCYDRYALYKYLKSVLKPGDTVLCYGSLYTSFIPKLTRRRKAKFIFNLCELPHVVEHESWKSRTLRYLFGKIVLGNSDGAVTITEELTSFSKKYLPSFAPIIKIPILVDYEKYNMKDESESSEVPYIFHAGALTESKDGFLGMVEAFGMVCQETEKPFRFYCTGNLTKCPHKEELKFLIEKYGLKDKLIFTDYISDEELKNYLCKASMVIINKYQTLQNQYCFSSKLAEYMAASKAIITTSVSESQLWLHNGNNCLMIEPGKTDLLANAILTVLTNEQFRGRIGRNANLSCKDLFDYHIYSKKFANYVSSI